MPGVVLPWNAAIHKRFDTIEVDFCLTGGRAEDMVEGEPFLFHMTEGDLLSIERERDALVAILEDLFVQQRAGTHCHADHSMIICQCRGRRKYITRHGHSLLDLYSLSFFFPSSFFLAPSSFFLPSCFLLSSFFLLPSSFFFYRRGVWEEIMENPAAEAGVFSELIFCPHSSNSSSSEDSVSLFLCSSTTLFLFSASSGKSLSSSSSSSSS